MYTVSGFNFGATGTVFSRAPVPSDRVCWYIFENFTHHHIARHHHLCFATDFFQVLLGFELKFCFSEAKNYFFSIQIIKFFSRSSNPKKGLLCNSITSNHTVCFISIIGGDPLISLMISDNKNILCRGIRRMGCVITETEFDFLLTHSTVSKYFLI